jgi:Metalloenzyme superfamily
MKITNLLFSLLTFWSTSLPAQNYTTDSEQYVVLVTLDGMRWQEIFEGADTAYFNTKHAASGKKQWYDPDHMVRRKRLMPFLWSELSTQGQLVGNRHLGSFVNLANQRCVSYPGYNEMLCGAADDQHITSNRLLPNPNTTILETLHQTTDLHNRVAVFASWDHFDAIYNTERSGLTVNAAFKAFRHPAFEALNQSAKRVKCDWGHKVRPDSLTMQYARQWMELQHPKVIHIALGETDEYGHEKSYHQYLDAAHRSDRMIAELWHWIQQDSFYQNRTTLLITTDHGRGRKTNTWRHHNSLIDGSDEVWIAALGPTVESCGENCHGQYQLGQLAASIATLLGHASSIAPPMLPCLDFLRPAAAASIVRLSE